MGVKAGSGGGVAVSAGAGLREYYEGKIAQLELAVRAKQHDLHRMEAQRNELNSRGARARAGRGHGGWAGGCGARPLWDLPPTATPPNSTRLPLPLPLQCACCARSCSCCRSRAATWGR